MTPDTRICRNCGGLNDVPPVRDADEVLVCALCGSPDLASSEREWA